MLQNPSIGIKNFRCLGSKMYGALIFQVLALHLANLHIECLLQMHLTLLSHSAQDHKNEK